MKKYETNKGQTYTKLDVFYLSLIFKERASTKNKKYTGKVMPQDKTFNILASGIRLGERFPSLGMFPTKGYRLNTLPKEEERERGNAKYPALYGREKHEIRNGWTIHK